ncbi:MAG: hypothetical protein AAF907_03200 [Planctomycetota bacterium]
MFSTVLSPRGVWLTIREGLIATFIPWRRIRSYKEIPHQISKKRDRTPANLEYGDRSSWAALVIGTIFVAMAITGGFGKIASAPQLQGRYQHIALLLLATVSITVALALSRSRR